MSERESHPSEAFYNRVVIIKPVFEPSAGTATVAIVCVPERAIEAVVAPVIVTEKLTDI